MQEIVSEFLFLTFLNWNHNFDSTKDSVLFELTVEFWNLVENEH